MTSRAEYRLILRQDNADLRLTDKGYKIGLISHQRYAEYTHKKHLLEDELKRLQDIVVTPANIDLVNLLKEKGSASLRQGISLYDLLRRSEIVYRDLLTIGLGMDLPNEITEQIDTQIKYEGYIQKQFSQVEKFEKLEKKLLPDQIDYTEVKGISTEARQKLNKFRPMSVGQASRISGVSPADISVLLVYLEQKRRKGVKSEQGET
jgi:tRNA uridine 5-carboxymethylaminomethyl modification enzyme